MHPIKIHRDLVIMCCSICTSREFVSDRLHTFNKQTLAGFLVITGELRQSLELCDGAGRPVVQLVQHNLLVRVKEVGAEAGDRCCRATEIVPANSFKGQSGKGVIPILICPVLIVVTPILNALVNSD